MGVRHGFLWSGVGLLFFLVLAYFVRFPVEAGAGFVTFDRLLSVLIFHNLFVLGVYVLVGLFLVFRGLNGKFNFV